MAADAHRLSLERIEAAARIIDPVFLDTPQFEAEPLSAALGVPVTLKVESVNPIRSFKGRGAEYFMAAVPADARLLCASAGNFGQAMAYAARKRGLPLIIYASVQANPLKVEGMRALGATVVLAGHDFDAAKEAAKEEAARTGAWMVEDGREAAISEGAGTIGLELLRLPRTLDVIAIPLGNGALLGGVARVLKARSPATVVIAVQAAGAPAMIESWRRRQLVRYDAIVTIADGIGVREPIPEALADLDGLIDDALLVSEDALLAAMRLLHQHIGLVVEPAGAAGIAAMLEHQRVFAGSQSGTIITGGNLTVDQIEEWLVRQPTSQVSA